MSLNTAHANNGVLIHVGEYILIYSDNVTLEFEGNNAPEFQGKKHGRIYLTSHRMIFNHKNNSDPMKSFSFPFITLQDVELEQPLFGANYIKGVVTAQPNGNFEGRAKFKLAFKSGGAIEYGQAMLRAAKTATRNVHNAAPPPYTPPSGPWYAAPPPAYHPPAQGYYGWVPPSEAFPDAPPVNSVFMTDNPPPYPGMVSPGSAVNAGCYSNAPMYPPAASAPMYPPLNNQYGAVAGYPNPPGASNYPSHAVPTATTNGVHNGHPQDPKAAEAAQSAYYDPNQPQTAYVPPPAYYEQPPSYQSAMGKKSQ